MKKLKLFGSLLVILILILAAVIFSEPSTETSDSETATTEVYE